MPRRARLSIPGIPWHIIQRGNNRTACFYAEDDYRKYLDTLNEQSQRHEGRYRSCLEQSETYVLACYRYIELNPVRACMVEHPGEYPWSSYAASGQGAPDPLIRPHAEYLGLARDEEKRRRVYRTLFRAHMEPELIDEIRSATNGNYALGSPRFKEEIEQMLERRATPGRPRKQSLSLND